MFGWSFTFRILAPLFLVMAATPGFAQITRDTIQVKHAMGGWSSNMQNFQADVMDTALKLTQNNYGPYKLLFDDRKLTYTRWNIAISNGKLDTSFTTNLEYPDQGGASVDYLTYPFLKSLLGLRRLIIRKEDEQKFASIDSLADLQQFSTGQGRFWPDTSVYRNAGIDVIPGESIDELFPMIVKKRFDFLPLSVLEYERAMAENPSDDLTVAKHIFIYYPVPLYLAVSKASPGVKERLEDGFHLLYSTSDRLTADAIFNRHFKIDDRLPHNPGDIIITLENPRLSPETNSKIAMQFNQRYCRLAKPCIAPSR